MAMPYAQFIDQKHKRHAAHGITVKPQNLHKSLFPFQRASTSWSLNKGRACVFAGTGLGKTRMQCETLRHIEGRRLIVAPLAVAEQTIDEGMVGLGMRIRHLRDGSEPIEDAIHIVNYERVHLYDHVQWDGVALDESSIIKSHDGHFRKYLTERFATTPFRFAYTATPSPNDHMELCTHAEFVGAATRSEILATYFTHDGGDTSKWRLKRHAVADYWKWVSSWALAFQHPSEIGFEQEGYDLPELLFKDYSVPVESSIAGGLFGDSKVSATQLYKVLKESAQARVDVAAAIVKSAPFEPCVVWCHTEEEQDLLEKALPDAASVKGSQAIDVKERGLMGFAGGARKVLITKPKIAAFGMNWQHCNRMVFCGVTYSFEQVYQAIRRCWRYGQRRPVTVHFVTCNAQESIKASISSKEEAFKSMGAEMGAYCKAELEAFID